MSVRHSHPHSRVWLVHTLTPIPSHPNYEQDKLNESLKLLDNPNPHSPRFAKIWILAEDEAL